MTLNLVYFAWVRERIGIARETIDTNAANVDDLLDQLAARGEGYTVALGDRTVIRVAVDQALAEPDTPLAGAREVAIFPPMTGG